MMVVAGGQGRCLKGVILWDECECLRGGPAGGFWTEGEICIKAWRHGKGQLLAEFKAAQYAQSQGTVCSPWAQPVAVEMEWSGLDESDINETELTKLWRSMGHKRWGRRMREGWWWGFGPVQNANPEPSLVKKERSGAGACGQRRRA